MVASLKTGFELNNNDNALPLESKSEARTCLRMVQSDIEKFGIYYKWFVLSFSIHGLSNELLL